MVEVTSSGQKRVATNDGRISINQGENSVKVETKTKAVLPPSQGGTAGDIQKAIDKIRLTGGVITLRNGTYLENADITIPSGVSLQGESFGGVTIVFQGAFAIKSTGTGAYSTGTIAITPGSDTVTGTDTLWSANLTTSHKIRINGIPFAIESIDSDTSLTLVNAYVGAPVSGASYLASVFVEKVEIQNIVVISSSDKGIVMNYVDLPTIKNVVCPAGFYSIGSSRIITEQFIVESAAGSGFVMQSTYFINMTRSIATNCGNHGFELSDCDGVVFTSCPSNGNAGNGMDIDSCGTIAVVISQTSGNTNGIKAINSDVQIISSNTSGNSSDGVNMSDSASECIISNSISNGNGAYGINIEDPSCANNRITGCQLLGNSTGDINDSGTNTTIIQEQGLTSVDWGDVGGTLADQTDLQSALDDKADADSVVETIVAGTNVTVNNTDPQNPIVSASGGGGSGDVVGPASSTDNAVAVFDGETGKLLQDSTLITNPAEGVLSLFELVANGTVRTDGIEEHDTDSGVTIDGVLIKDGEVDGLDIGAITATETELNYTDGVTSAIQTQLNSKANDADVVHDTGNETVGGVKTFTSDPIIPDEAYNATNWNGSLEPPTKNAIRDKIETMGGGGDVVGPASATDDAIATFNTTTGKLIQNTDITLNGGVLSRAGDIGIGTTGDLNLNPDGQLLLNTVPVVTTTDTQTLSNKTLTSPVVNTPTGIVKGDVGLGNVDNTSDATKNAASVTLTNKTIDGDNNTISNIGQAQLVNGVAIQVVSTLSSAVSTTTGRIPYDDSIPQSGEGAEVMTVTITPKSATNILVITSTVNMSDSVVNNCSIALFQDSVANALAGITQVNAVGTGAVQNTLVHTMVAGTTSATTFKIRGGGSLAGTTTFNGSAGNRRFGAISKSSITVTEYKAS